MLPLQVTHAKPGSAKTIKYVDFQEEVKLLADRVGRIVATAPKFEDWPIAKIEQVAVIPADSAIPQKLI
jgi:hypothetical protein